ncbi:hypothetical protein PRIPAC_75897 [Pristionchus pacificus]|uniref:Uncharacterized protein n=1 Tax=Pristionchus pacificus TaxID=54126 RepID=A0A2A6BG59_PRIPA|nr:hypothetical protein PRIPAC_75897 [Pristionchus pacificus]|eukprot:PDM64791.1 hypothetical protein PRIPAC_53047 [Pristionchus pacificus]
MRPSPYAYVCAILSGVANLVLWTGYDAHVFIVESVLHSVNGREPDRIGAHDGYYGLAVMNIFYMLSNLVVPSLMNYFRCKWILLMGGSFFTFYFLSFQFLNKFLYFFSCAVLGLAFATFNVGYSGYLTEFSTRQTLERNQALNWGISCLSVFCSGVLYMVLTTASAQTGIEIVSKYREYSDGEVRIFFLAMAILGGISMVLFAFLPDRRVEGCIAETTERTATLKEQINGASARRSSYPHPHTLLPLHRTALAEHKFLPAYFGMSFSVGSTAMSLLTMSVSSRVKNFSFKPLAIINFIVHTLIYILVVCLIPKWSTVMPNDEPSLLIPPSIPPVLLLGFLFGLADAANNTCRTVISSFLIPSSRQQTFGASRFYHALAASILFFASPSLNVYTYVAVLSTVLILATITYLYTCAHVSREERKQPSFIVTAFTDLPVKRNIDSFSYEVQQEEKKSRLY